MSPPLGHVEETPVKVNGPAASLETTAKNCPGLTEHNYMGLSDSTSDSSVVNSGLYEKDNLNLKATELRLGLPGLESPVSHLDLSLSTNTKLGEKNLFPLGPMKETSAEEKHSRTSACPTLQKTIVSGNKRVFSDAIDGFSEVRNYGFVEGKMASVNCEAEKSDSSLQGKFIGSSGLATMPLGTKQGSGTWHGEHSGAVMLSSRPSSNLVGKGASVKDHSGTCAAMMKETISPKISQDRLRVSNESNNNQINAANNPGIAPAAKAQVVGWPPIRSYRKNTLAAASKGNDEVDGKPGLGVMFVKVSMDGAPYLRKVDLKTCGTYTELSSSLEKMFSCFTIGQCGSHGAPGKDVLTESKLIDLIHGSEYVLSYEDKDGDWMLVGDVPWDMFVDSCRRLRIMKGSDAIGLAPRAMEKSSSRN